MMSTVYFQKCIFLTAKINVLFCDIRLTFRYDLQAAALYDFRRMFERNAFIFMSRNNEIIMMKGL